MNQTPKSKIRHYIPPPFPQNKSQNNYLIENPKISTNHNNTKFFISRNFGQDITNSLKNNDQNNPNTSTINVKYRKNRNSVNSNDIYIKKHSSATSISDINTRQTTNNNKLGGYVSRKNCNNNRGNNSRQRNTRIEINKGLQLNTKLHNSISYGNSTKEIRQYTANSIRNNTNMISVKVSNINKSRERNNNNRINVRVNNTNIISYLDKRQRSINNTSNNNDLIKNIKSKTNRETMITSMNNKINRNKNESRSRKKENNKENINENRTEYKINIIQYDSKERTRRNNKSDIKRDVSVKKEEKKIKYFDESKINNVQIPKEYINTIYYNLLKEEECPSMISLKNNKNFMTEQKEINAKMRSILIDWLIDVHFKFGFTDETLFLSVSIIDRYISVSQISRSHFQLLGITALMIACKHEEIDLPKIDDFIYITDHAYVKNEVLKMEYDILNKLNFSFLYPSPIKFYEYLSLHFNFDKKMHMMGKYLLETFLLDVKNFKYKPSIISCACAYIVMKFFKMKNYYETYDKKFYNIKDEEYNEGNVKECAREICFLVDNINKTNYQSCIKKYSKPEQEKVAILIMNN